MQQQQQQQSKEDLMVYTNDLCRLASKAHAWGLHKDDLARLHSDIDAIKHIAATSSSTSTSSAPSSRSSSFSSLPSSSPPSSPSMGSALSSPLSSSPPASSASSGFLSSTLSALSANAPFHTEADAAGQVVAAADLMSAMTGTNANKAAAGSGDGPKRRNRGKNLPKDMKRACTICKAEKTSQWRSGADGRPTLCNACGLRYRHSMKQHRQYLARTQVRSGTGHEASVAMEEEQQQQLPALHHVAATNSSADLFQHLLRLRQQQAQHMSKSDSADAIGSEEDELSSCSSSSLSSLVSSPIDAIPRRSSIYNLLN